MVSQPNGSYWEMEGLLINSLWTYNICAVYFKHKNVFQCKSSKECNQWPEYPPRNSAEIANHFRKWWLETFWKYLITQYKIDKNFEKQIQSCPISITLQGWVKCDPWAGSSPWNNSIWPVVVSHNMALSQFSAYHIELLQ